MGREFLIRFATFLAGFYFVLEFILSKEMNEKVGIASIHESVSFGFLAIGAMAFGLGIINLLRIHGSNIIFQRRGGFYSLVLLAGFFSMTFFALGDWKIELERANRVANVGLLGRYAEKINTEDQLKTLKTEMKQIPELRDSVPLISSLEQVKNSQSIFQDASQRIVNEERESWVTDGYNFLNKGVFVPLGAAMFSLLGFYIAAAAYRAFRVRSLEASLMMIAAVLVVCGQTSFTLMLWDGFSPIRNWLLQVPNSAAFRGIAIGAGVAGLVLAFRMWFSVESKSFGKKR